MRPALFLSTMACSLLAGFLAAVPADPSHAVEISDALLKIAVGYGIVTLLLLLAFSVLLWLSQAKRRRRQNDRFERSMREIEEWNQASPREQS